VHALYAIQKYQDQQKLLNINGPAIISRFSNYTYLFHSADKVYCSVFDAGWPGFPKKGGNGCP